MKNGQAKHISSVKNTSSKAQPSKAPVFPMRINKYLAWEKHSTRRGADELIKKKLVFLNNRLAVLGDQVQERDSVEVRFRGRQKPHVYFAYNKPRGIVTHSAQGGEQDIKGALTSVGQHGVKHSIKSAVALKDVFPIGRLDKDSHGLMILTSDGRITEGLLSPKHSHEKEYLVTTKEPLRSSFKAKMEAGVKIEREQTRPCKVQILGDKKFSVVLTEGKKHQIRRMCAALFQEVDDLKRIRIMNIELGDLPEGSHRKIEGEELAIFLRALGFN